jgi:HNH endonuclease
VSIYGPNKGVAIGKLKRSLIIAAYDGCCWICGGRPDVPSLDHVIPRQDGGGVDIENLRPAHAGCNGERDRRLRKMAGRGRRDAISRELGDTWYRKYDLPEYSEHGKLVHLDPGLEAALPADVRANVELSRQGTGPLESENDLAARALFRPPAADGSDRLLALRAMVDAKGHAIKPPCCTGYANCCRCPVCKLREDKASNGMRRLRAA